ncbi:MAG: hypothetical protein ACKOPS_22590, partial [Cyanobium sp.]
RTSSDVSLPEAWAEDFSAVLTNSFDTMLVADGNGQLLAYAAMAPPDPPPPLAPVRLGAVAHWCGQHPDRLALVLNRNAELLALRHGQLVFARRAGRWFFLAPEAIVNQMGGPRGSEELRRAVYASCLDASFAGTGACLGILNKEFSSRLREIAPEANDHLRPLLSAKARLRTRRSTASPSPPSIAACARRSWRLMAPRSSITRARSSPPAPSSRCPVAAAAGGAAPQPRPSAPTAWASRCRPMAASRASSGPQAPVPPPRAAARRVFG